MKYFQEHENVLKAKFEFQNFQKALDFINQVWNIAEITHHHPDILLHDYKFVTISSYTHDAWGIITDKDYALVKLVEACYKK